MRRRSRAAFVLPLLLVATSRLASAQQASLDLPNAPGFQVPQTSAPPASAPGRISGTAHDLNNDPIAGAHVILETVTLEAVSSARTTDANPDGLFLFPAVDPGPYKLTITAPGFTPWVGEGTLHPSQDLNLSLITLSLAVASTDVEVTATRTEVAAAQIKLEEKQRVLGVFPNFYATYIWNAAPLTTRQKFGLAWKSSIDPVTIGVTGITAGIQQATNTFSGYGQGATGYGKRFGAAYADGVSSTFLGGAIFPSLFHQDPRYFVMGHGTIRHRFLYAIATPVICRGDNYKWQPNYSNVLGNLTSAAISNAYYPASNRNGASLTITNSLIGTASGAASSLIQEFFLHRITPKVPDYGVTSTATPHPTTP